MTAAILATFTFAVGCLIGAIYMHATNIYVDDSEDDPELFAPGGVPQIRSGETPRTGAAELNGERVQ